MSRARAHATLAIAIAIALATACGGGRPAPPPVAAQPLAPPPLAAPAQAERAIERVVIISVDGLRPADCAQLPVIGALSREGAFAAPPDGALSVMPSVTYPSHTSMVTGVVPRRHGIITNLSPDPSPEDTYKNSWRWFRADVRVPTIYDVAFDAGLRTALVQWPVTVGARATALLPEFSMKGVMNDFELMRQLSTPGLFEKFEQRYPGFSKRYVPHRVLDDAVVDAALALLSDVSPHLMLVHIIEVDGASHHFGPDSPEADAARQRADTQVGRVLEALRASDAWPRTVLAVVSDHGFLPVTKQVAPHVLLAAHGLSDRVWMNNSGGSAYLYLRSAEDTEAEALTRKMFDELVRDPANGIAAVLDRDAIEQAGGDADAFLAIEAAPGFALSRERTGPAIVDALATYRGTHGYVPTRPEMRASMLFYGPSIAPSVLHAARLIDLAPTVASWLGLHLEDTDGAPLSIELKAAPSR